MASAFRCGGSRLWVGAGAALLLVACFPSPAPKAAQTLRCAEDSIQIEENTAYSHVATGCGKSDVMVLESGGKFSSLRERVAFELACADSEIKVTILSPSLYGVTACGKKIVYTYVPNVGVVEDTTQSAPPRRNSAANTD